MTYISLRAEAYNDAGEILNLISRPATVKRVDKPFNQESPTGRDEIHDVRLDLLDSDALATVQAIIQHSIDHDQAIMYTASGDGIEFQGYAKTSKPRDPEQDAYGQYSIRFELTATPKERLP